MYIIQESGDLVDKMSSGHLWSDPCSNLDYTNARLSGAIILLKNLSLGHNS